MIDGLHRSSEDVYVNIVVWKTDELRSITNVCGNSGKLKLARFHKNKEFYNLTAVKHVSATTLSSFLNIITRKEDLTLIALEVHHSLYWTLDQGS